MNTLPKQIFDDAPEMDRASVSGKWFAIRLTPDMVTGEALNIGVAFIDNKRKVHFRLLDSVRAFECLYGKSGAGNIAFLMSALRAGLEQGGKPASPSPHIAFTPTAYASGESVHEILDELYATMVPLGTHAGAMPEDGEQSAYTVDTRKLRRQVFKTIQSQAPGLFRQAFREEPVLVADSSGQRHALDLPIWAGEDIFVDGRRYGTIVSAHFVSPVHRGYHLDRGALTLGNARIMVGKGTGGFFILRPHDGQQGYTDSVLNDIDNDIDDAVFQFSREKNNIVVIESDPARIAEAAMEFTYA